MSLLRHPDPQGQTIETYGFAYLGFRARKLRAGEAFSEATGDREVAIVLLGGRCSVTSTAGEFPNVGGRRDVFSGLPHTLYLPVETSYTLTTAEGCDVAWCYSKAETKHPAALVGPEDVRVRSEERRVGKRV